MPELPCRLSLNTVVTISQCFRGRTPVSLRGKGPVQAVAKDSLASTTTKWTGAATSAAALPALVVEALTVARSGRRGPAYIDLPTDVLTSEAPESSAAPPARGQ